MARRLLCVTGSSDSDVLELAANDFLNNSGKDHIVVIADNSSNMAVIDIFLARHRIHQYDIISPDMSSISSLQHALKTLKSASGIILDKTLSVHHACSTQPLKGLIVELYNAGVPILGCVEQSYLLQTTSTSHHETFLRSHALGLISDHLIFSPATSNPAHMAATMQRLGVSHGVEISRRSCAVFVNGQLDHTQGDEVLHIETHIRKKIRYSSIH